MMLIIVISLSLQALERVSKLFLVSLEPVSLLDEFLRNWDVRALMAAIPVCRATLLSASVNVACAASIHTHAVTSKSVATQCVRFVAVHMRMSHSLVVYSTA